MDKIDTKTLISLDKNVRQSNLQLAKKIRVSRDVVNYRIEKLMRKNILTGFYAIINGSKLGNQYYKLLIKFKSLSKDNEHNLISWLKQRKEVVWMGSSDGNWNLILTITSKSLKELNDFIEDIFLNFGDYFMKKELITTKRIRMFNEKYLTKGKFIYEYDNNFMEEIAKVDEKDYLILKELSKNGRSFIINIAKKINLTPEATAKRIRKLIKNKLIIGIKPRINFTELGYHYYHVFLSVKNANKNKEIINYYKQHSGCVAILEHIGYYDLHLEFVLESSQKLRDALTDLRERFGEALLEYEPLTIYAEHLINPFPY